MRHWFQVEPDLRDVFKKHFATVDDRQFEAWAREIYQEASFAYSLQWIERSDAKPIDDREAIKKAAKNMQQAVKCIEGVGWHGMGALSDIGARAYRNLHDLPAPPVLSRLDKLNALNELLLSIAYEIEAAAESIDERGHSIVSAFSLSGKTEPSQGRPRGRPMETMARYTALQAYDAFVALSGERPKVSTDAHGYGHRAYGPYLDFIHSVFSCLEIHASPENWARQACKEKNP